MGQNRWMLTLKSTIPIPSVCVDESVKVGRGYLVHVLVGRAVIDVMLGRVVDVMMGRVEVEGEVDCEMDGGRWNASGRRKVEWVVGEGNDSLCWVLEGCLGVAGFSPFLGEPVSRR